MDKLTLTRQFGIRDFPWEVSGRNWMECNNIYSYRKFSIDLMYLWDRNRGRGKAEDFT